MKKSIRQKSLFLTMALLGVSETLLANNIEVYNAYGNEEQLIIHGRMLKKDKEKEVNKEQGIWINFWNALDFFHNDEIKNKKIVLTVDEVKYETQGDDEGYFDFDIKTAKNLSMGYKDIALQIEGTKGIHYTQAAIIGSEKMLGIISDIDDTVLVSNVTNKRKLLVNMFWKNYKQREVISTMADRFQKILKENPPKEPSRLFFLSGSPQHLFNYIEKFLDYHNFPKHITILKQVHGDNSDPLFDQMAYKTEKIEELIALYPNMQWLMFGDSGEKDRDIYAFIKEKYPSKVKGYYIRNVQSGEIDFFD
jgi:phosphatidate phosphatase APP1